jgi:hypothetical protein
MPLPVCPFGKAFLEWISTDYTNCGGGRPWVAKVFQTHFRVFDRGPQPLAVRRGFSVRRLEGRQSVRASRLPDLTTEDAAVRRSNRIPCWLTSTVPTLNCNRYLVTLSWQENLGTRITTPLVIGLARFCRMMPTWWKPSGHNLGVFKPRRSGTNTVRDHWRFFGERVLRAGAGIFGCAWGWVADRAVAEVNGVPVPARSQGASA